MLQFIYVSDYLKLNNCRFGHERKYINVNCIIEYGAGGTFALYSLLCRHAKLSILPNQEATDDELSSYVTEGPIDSLRSSALKLFFEKHENFRKGLLVFVLVGTCMAIGDGVLTPSISGA